MENYSRQKNQMVIPRLDLDWVRGLAALAVLIGHILFFYPVDGWIDLRHAGQVGVEVFFVLSGFLISLSWQAKPVLSDYMSRRAWRILPLMWIAMAVVFFILVPFFYEWSLLRADHWLVVLIHFLGLQSAIPLEIPGLFIGLPLWTLTVELCFYALLPFWWKWFIRSPSVWVVISFFVAVLWRVGAGEVADSLKLSEQWSLYLPLQLPGQIFGFSVGMLLAWMFLQAQARRVNIEPCSERMAHYDRFDESGCLFSGVVWLDPWDTIGKENWFQKLVRVAGRLLRVWPEDMYRWVGVRFGLAMLFVSIVFFRDLWDSGLSILLLPVLAGIVIWSSLFTRRDQRSSLSGLYRSEAHAAFSYFGRISYSLYLWHFAVLAVLSRVAHSGDWSYFQFVVAGVSASICLAMYSYEKIEVPFMRCRNA